MSDTRADMPVTPSTVTTDHAAGMTNAQHHLKPHELTVRPTGPDPTTIRPVGTRPAPDRSGSTPPAGTRPVGTDHPTTRAKHDRPATPDQPPRRTVDRPEPGILHHGLTAVLWVLSLIATWMAASGQLGFADWASVKGVNRYGVPAILELSAVCLLLLGYRHGRRRRSPYPLWLLACCVGSFAVYTNIVHAGHRAGMVYGAASAMALLLWLVKLRLDLTYYLVEIQHIPPARPKLGKLFLVAPKLAHRAWVIAIRRRVLTTDEAVSLAEVWTGVYRAVLRKTDQGKAEARRTAWAKVYEMSGGSLGVLPDSVEIATVEVTVRQAPEHPTALPTGDPTEDPTGDEVDGTDHTDHRHPTTPTTKPTSNRPGRKTTTRPVAAVRLVWSDTIKANAARIRSAFADRPPTSVRQVRDVMGWSADRAKPAYRAYLEGADRDEAAS